MVNLGTVALILNGDRSTNYPSAKDFTTHGVPFVNAGHLNNGKIDMSRVDYISSKKCDSLSGAKLHKGDILICLRGSLGKYAEVKCDGGAPASSLAVIRPNEIVNSKYLVHVISSSLFQKQINVENNGSSQPNLSAKSISEFQIPLPSINEQREIAEALSDIDELIFSLEKLIAKKKAVKQGTMQDLLTGKKRLPGFNGEWSHGVFGELFEIKTNNVYTRDQLSFGGKIKNIHYGDILTKYGAHIDASSTEIPTLIKPLSDKDFTDNAFVHSGDIIIADTAEDSTVGKAVEVINVSGKVLSGQHTIFCHPIIRFAPKYLGYYINCEEFHGQMLPFVTGTKVSSISKTSLLSLTVRYPSYEEQRKIAVVLSNMDNEIESLEKKLAKYRNIKQGMMQQLLTGQIRLV